MFDSHLHLNLEPLYSSFEEHWKTAQANGVASALIVGTDEESSKKAVEIATKLNLFASVGIHPHESAGANLQDLMTERVVAIGECGLDYFQLSDNPEEAKRTITTQKRIFGTQIQLAKNTDKTLVIHCRGEGAYHDLFDTFDHFITTDGKTPRFVLHCMSGDLTHLEAGLKRGGYISFAGNITYRNADNLRELLKSTPLERLLLETDAPFLPPVPHRGKDNEPYFIAETYKYVSTVLGVELAKIEALVTANARQVFRISI